MDFYEAVKSRRTIRDFLDKKVDKKIIERILSTGLMAPTNDHLRDWEFVVIRIILCLVIWLSAIHYQK